MTAKWQRRTVQRTRRALLQRVGRAQVEGRARECGLELTQSLRCSRLVSTRTSARQKIPTSCNAKQSCQAALDNFCAGTVQIKEASCGAGCDAKTIGWSVCIFDCAIVPHSVIAVEFASGTPCTRTHHGTTRASLPTTAVQLHCPASCHVHLACLKMDCAQRHLTPPLVCGCERFLVSQTTPPRHRCRCKTQNFKGVIAIQAQDAMLMDRGKTKPQTVMATVRVLVHDHMHMNVRVSGPP